MSPSKPSLLDDKPGPDQVFQKFLAKQEFKIQQCSECQRHVFYPRLLCPHCGSENLSWKTASGKGTVYSTSIPRGGKDGDYNISLVDLAEGPRMLSRVENIAPDLVTIGMPVQAFVGAIDGQAVVLFEPESPEGKS